MKLDLLCLFYMLDVAFLFLRIGMQCLRITLFVGKQADVEGTTLIGALSTRISPFV